MNKALKDPVFILLLAIGAFLIFANLGNMYLWQDEAETAVLSRNTLEFGYPKAFDGTNIVDHQLEYRGDYAWVYHPWLKFYVVAGSFAAFGTTAFAARLPFAILGFFSILLMYILARRLAEDKTTARIATMLLVFSVPFLLMVRQCRWYAFSIFFTMVLLLAYQNFAEKRKWGALKFALACILFFHSAHGVFIGVFIGLAAHYALFYRKTRNLKNVLLVFSAIAVFTVPWLLYCIAWQHFTFLYNKGWQRQPFNIDHLRQNFEYYVRVTNKYVIPAVFLGVVVIIRLIKNKINPFSQNVIKKSSLWLVCLAIISSMILLVFVDQRHFRYIAHLISLYLILEAIILAGWMKSSKLLTWLVIAVIVFTGFLNNPKLKFSLFNYFYEITHDYNCPNEGVVKYLNEHATSRQTVKIPYEDIVLIFYTDLKVENPQDFRKESYPDWIVIRKDWIGPAFYKSDYYKNIQSRYEKIVIDYPDIQWGNMPDMGYHKYRTEKTDSKVIIYKKKSW